AFLAALWSHFAAILLMPALVGYLALTLLRREAWTRRRLKTYLVFGIPFLAILVLFGWQFLKFRNLNLIASQGEVPPSQDLAGIVLRVLVYFGAPAVALGLLAPLVSRDRTGRAILFLLVCGVVPVLELLVIARLGLALIAWYYAFFAVSAFAILAAV